MIRAVVDVFRVLNLPCREHTKLFSRQLDEPVSRGVALGLRIHILYCTGCVRFRRQIRKLHEMTGGLLAELSRGEPLPDAVRESLLRRIAERSKKI